jgi:hypothetical protein
MSRKVSAGLRRVPCSARMIMVHSSSWSFPLARQGEKAWSHRRITWLLLPAPASLPCQERNFFTPWTSSLPPQQRVARSKLPARFKFLAQTSCLEMLVISRSPRLRKVPQLGERRQGGSSTSAFFLRLRP